MFDRSRPTRALLTVAGLCLALAACNSDDDGPVGPLQGGDAEWPEAPIPQPGDQGQDTGGDDDGWEDEEDEDEETDDGMVGGGIRLGGVRLGSKPPAAAPPPEPALDVADIVEMGVPSDTAPPPAAPYDGPPSSGTGILSKARHGGVGSRATPYGSAGRVRVAPRKKGPGSSPGPLGRSTRGGTPLGAAPRASDAKPPRLAAPLSFPGTPDGKAERNNAPGGMFGTPPPLSRAGSPPPPAQKSAVLSYSEPPTDEVVVMEEEDPAEAAALAAPPASAAAAPAGIERKLPTWGRIDDPWLREALAKAEELVASYPVQAYLEFSQEPHLPFTLVIARATPAMAVRAMVNFVEFLASIYTPPRARIELVNVAHLDRSFDKNVQAALEPYFGNNVEVEPEPGRVDILFTDPDPGWGAYPRLPME